MEIIFFVIFGIVSRLIPHPANMTAVGSIALFTGARLKTGKAIVITMLTMLASDIILGLHPVMWATYGSLLVAVCVGKWIGHTAGISRVTGGVFTASFIFFVLTNFGVWLSTPLYPKTVNGLIECYIMAVPFFRNSLLGDMVYGYVFFFVSAPFMALYTSAGRRFAHIVSR